jgi:hypothetical protein
VPAPGEPSRCGRLLMGSATWEPRVPQENQSKLATILCIFSTNILANFDCVGLQEERGWCRTTRKLADPVWRLQRHHGIPHNSQATATRPSEGSIIVNQSSVLALQHA